VTADPRIEEPGIAQEQHVEETPGDELSAVTQERDEYLDALQEAWTQAASALYAQASAEQPSGNGGAASSSDEEVVVDAEYEVVDE
jgi:hypothetical protein